MIKSTKFYDFCTYKLHQATNENDVVNFITLC